MLENYCIYLITNLVNGKFYVGKTNKPSRRWGQHKKVAKGGLLKYPNEFSVVHKAIQKYGENHFKFNVLEGFDTEDEAYYFESWWIEFLRSNVATIGYNLNAGGKGGFKPSQETLKKKSLAMLGKRHTKETKNKLSHLNSGQNNPNYGLKRSQITLTKMSDKQKGEHNPSAKLTEAKVLLIREDFATGNYSYQEIADKYDIVRDNAYRIIKRKIWKHI